MSWPESNRRRRRLLALTVLLAAASLSAGCWQPLYGTRPALTGEGVQDKFAATEIPPIVAPKGQPVERLAVGMFNALQFDLHNGSGATTSTLGPLYRLTVTLSTSDLYAVIDPTSGRPNTSVVTLLANYQLIEVATGKAVVIDIAQTRVDYAIPGSQQRFAGQRGRRNAEDQAVEVVAGMIRNRLASYFVAGT
jgi:LPS-assembly lipoprotein